MTMTRFERWSVWTTTAATLVTGVAYWWMKDMMTSTDPWAVINHPLEPWMLKAHILVAPLMVFSVGLITSRHIWRHFRMRVQKGRRSGITAALAFVVLTVSGYVLQVVTAETLLRILGWVHLGLGILYSAAVVAHWPATRQQRATRREGVRQPAGTWRPSAELGGSRAPDHERRRRRGSGRRAARRASAD